jgi:hypothetical protein
MSEQVAKRINRAIQDCLVRCYDNPMPLGVLAEFLTSLHADPSWQEDEIEQVELGVLQLLAAVSGRSVEIQQNA